MPLSVGIVLFTVHYINRDIIYPCLLKTTTKVPLEIVLSAFTFTFANGYLQCVGAMRGRNGNVLMEVLGVAVFVLGMWVNIKSDRMMQAAKLKVAREEGQQSKYIVIRGFLFEYVSAPNYLGEIIEWIGYFLVVRNFESFLFMVSTFCVLTPGAIKRHQWNL
jgi:3-oxo-5-alpha-steroid 4-dehydrogenase 1